MREGSSPNPGINKEKQLEHVIILWRAIKVSINMKPTTILIYLAFFGLAMIVHGYPGTRDSGIGQASFNRIKRSGKVFDTILAVKAAIINDALELKNKGLAFLEEVVNHFKAKVQMGQSFVGGAGGTNSSTTQRPPPVTRSH